jgi:hypothetical protein
MRRSEWLDEDSRRHDYDYLHRYEGSRNHRVEVRWNPGSHELYRHDPATDEVEVLGLTSQLVNGTPLAVHQDHRRHEAPARYARTRADQHGLSVGFQGGRDQELRVSFRRPDLYDDRGPASSDPVTSTTTTEIDAAVDDFLGTDSREGVSVTLYSGRFTEIVYGTTWIDPHQPDRRRTVAWNPRSGHLYSNGDRTRSDLELLGTYPSRERVEAAIAGWPEHLDQPDGVNWLRRQVASTQPPPPHVEHGRYHGVVVRANGGLALINETVTANHIRDALGDVTVITASANCPGVPPGQLILYLDDNAHRDGRPPNTLAPALNGTGWPILGDAIVCNVDPDTPVPDRVSLFLLSVNTERALHPGSPAVWIKRQLHDALRLQTHHRQQPPTADPFVHLVRDGADTEVSLLEAERAVAHPPIVDPPNGSCTRHRAASLTASCSAGPSPKPRPCRRINSRPARPPAPQRGLQVRCIEALAANMTGLVSSSDSSVVGSDER